LDQPALTTDVIVGFPGESEADFQATCTALEAIGCSRTNIFPYSRRRGTPAAEFVDQVPAEVKAERVERLQQLDERLRQRYLEQLAGRRLRVLIEGLDDTDDRRGLGTACRYVPVAVTAACGADLAAARRPGYRGQLVDVLAGPVRGGQLLALPLDESPANRRVAHR
ncbi:MAG: hypothetical protein K1X74_23105, partial [Pirellulales bacterium]|nr:hypothetical protein [Pirellulales bacterium]